jgi:8-oxo-dGTP pyrophosphatase MutT (NUDIX family)/phosphohistidine phosphatase SixA
MASTPPGSKLIKAAGAVVARPAPDGRDSQVLLVHRTKYDDWSLPKGKQEPGEHLLLTATREVFEEAGVRLVLGRRLVSVRYQVSGRPKRVHYWSARVAGTDDAAVPNHEVDQVAWLTLARARERASYERDLGVLDDFVRLPADTVPLILLRHAQAVHKSDWEGEDTSRPLDVGGRADAKTLSSLLACFAPAALAPRVISSVAVRCTETVRPYAELTGATVQPESSLETSGTDAADSAALIARAVAAGQPTVFCAHRENLPLLLAAALDALGVENVPAGVRDPLPTAGFWVLHMAAGELIAADAYDLSEALSSATRAAARRSWRRRSRTAINPASSTAATMITYSAYLVTPL